MKYSFRIISLSLSLVTALTFFVGMAQAAPARTLAALSAKLQGSHAGDQNKSLSGPFAPTPVVTTLAGTQKRLAGKDAPKRLRIDPQATVPSTSQNKFSVQLKSLAHRLGRDTAQTAPAKRLDAQLSAAPE